MGPGFSRLEELTDDQRARLFLFREVWLRQILRTERVDRRRAEAALLALRADCGPSTPARFVWCDSPATCLLALELLLSNKMAPMRERVLASSEDALRRWLRGSLRHCRDDLREPLGLWNDLWAVLRPKLTVPQRTALRWSLDDTLEGSLRVSLGASVADSLRDSLSDSLSRWLWNSVPWRYSQASWIGLHLFCRNVLGVQYPPALSRGLDLYRNAAQSCCWWVSHEGYVVASERPISVALDAENRFHREDIPALVFADGWEVGQPAVLEDVGVHRERLPRFFASGPLNLHHDGNL
jgi:hypothetical protein